MPLYHSAMYDHASLPESVWEDDRTKLPQPESTHLTEDATCEVAIIGAGYCGLSAAYHLASRGIDVCALEAGDIGWGASGRNGGFCCVGASFLGSAELQSIYGVEETKQFYRSLIDAVHLVEDLAAHENINLGKVGEGIWTFAHKPSRVRDLETQALCLQSVGAPAEIVQAADFQHTAFRCTEQFGALHEKIGFGLHPLAYCLGLAAAVVKRGAKLYTQAKVLRITREGAAYRLHTREGSVRARKIIVAANGWLPEELFPELAGRSLPIMSNITVTSKISESAIQEQNWCTDAPASNTRNHLSYIRMLPGNRLMLGGRGDTTGTDGGLKSMQRILERRRTKLFPAFANLETTQAWRGFISATRRLTPAVGLLPDDPSVAYAFGCHGNGVAFMTWAGKILAQLVVGERVSLPAPIRGLPPRFPLPALRIWMLRAMLLRAHAEDEFL